MLYQLSYASSQVGASIRECWIDYFWDQEALTHALPNLPPPLSVPKGQGRDPGPSIGAPTIPLVQGTGRDHDAPCYGYPPLLAKI